MAKLWQNVMTWRLTNGDIAQTSLWWLTGDAATPSTVGTRFAADFLLTAWPASGGILTNFHSSIVLTQTAHRQIDITTGETLAVQELIYSRAGTGSANPLPAEVSTVISLRTAVAGASFRGRCYLPPMTVGPVTSAGILDSTVQTNVATAWQNGVQALNADTFATTSTVGVYSRKLRQLTAVTAVRMGNVFDCQRRRRNVASESYVTLGV